MRRELFVGCYLLIGLVSRPMKGKKKYLTVHDFYDTTSVNDVSMHGFFLKCRERAECNGVYSCFFRYFISIFRAITSFDLLSKTGFFVQRQL